jgi:4-amino-4-deoxy-L-arabinose transferase-like glycosyltransferase
VTSSLTRRGNTRAWTLAVAALAATVLWFITLGTRSLYDPDEGRYAEIPREMLQHGDWVIPHLNELVYLEKPPLQYWLTALSLRIFGETEFAARLCTGTAGFLSLLMVFFVGRRLWGTEAGVKALMLTAASTFFVLLGHQLTLDMLLSLWLLTGLSCFLLAQSQRDNPHSRARLWMLGCWAALALAVLTKGLIGMIAPAATLVLYMLGQRDYRVLREMNFRWGLPLFLVIATPWFVLAARANADFLRFFVIREHFQRFLTPIEHRTEPWWFFIIVLTVGVLPWAPQALAAMLTTWRSSRPRGQFDSARLLWVWCVFVFVFFSFSDSKLITYVLPVIAPLALLCASRSMQHQRGLLIAGSALTIAGCTALVVLAWSGAASKIGLVAMQVQITVTWTAVMLCIAACVAILLAIRECSRAALTLLCTAWFLSSMGILVAGTEAQGIFSAKEVALTLKTAMTNADAPVDTPVFSVQLYEQSLPFYLNHATVLVDYRDEFSLGLDQDPIRGIATLQEFADRWRQLADGYAVMRPRTRDFLLAQQLPMREIARIRNRVVVSRR